MFFTPAKTQFSFTLQWVIATVGGFLLSLFWVEVGEKPDVGVMQAALGSLAIAFPQGWLLQQNIFFGRWVLAAWMLATLLAWAMITAIGVGAVGWIVPSTQIFPLRLFWGTALGTISGFVIGVVQWIVIRQFLAVAWRWILISTIGWAIAVPIGSIVGIILLRLTKLFLGEVVGLAMTWIVLAIFTGINTYRFLRQ